MRVLCNCKEAMHAQADFCCCPTHSKIDFTPKCTKRVHGVHRVELYTEVKGVNFGMV